MPDPVHLPDWITEPETSTLPAPAPATTNDAVTLPSWVTGEVAPQGGLPQPTGEGFLPSLRAGVSNIDNRMIGTYGTLQEMLGGHLGNLGMEERGRGLREWANETRAGGPIQGIQDIEGFGDLWSMLGYAAPEEMANLGLTFIGGLGGRAAGGAIGTGVGSVFGPGGALAGNVIGQIGGALGGAGLTSWLMNTAANYDAFIEDEMPTELARLEATRTAVPQAALDVIVPGGAAARFTRRTLSQPALHLARRIMGGAGRAALVEAPTEALQELMQVAVSSGYTGDPLFSDENLMQMANAAVIGGFVGGSFGAVEGAHHGRLEAKDAPRRQYAAGLSTRLDQLSEQYAGDPEIAEGLTSAAARVDARVEENRYLSAKDMEVLQDIERRMNAAVAAEPTEEAAATEAAPKRPPSQPPEGAPGAGFTKGDAVEFDYGGETLRGTFQGYGVIDDQGEISYAAIVTEEGDPDARYDLDLENVRPVVQEEAVETVEEIEPVEQVEPEPEQITPSEAVEITEEIQQAPEEIEEDAVSELQQPEPEEEISEAVIEEEAREEEVSPEISEEADAEEVAVLEEAEPALSDEELFERDQEQQEEIQRDTQRVNQEVAQQRLDDAHQARNAISIHDVPQAEWDALTDEIEAADAEVTRFTDPTGADIMEASQRVKVAQRALDAGTDLGGVRPKGNKARRDLRAKLREGIEADETLIQELLDRRPAEEAAEEAAEKEVKAAAVAAEEKAEAARQPDLLEEPTPEPEEQARAAQEPEPETAPAEEEQPEEAVGSEKEDVAEEVEELAVEEEAEAEPEVTEEEAGEEAEAKKEIGDQLDFLDYVGKGPFSIGVGLTNRFSPLREEFRDFLNDEAGRIGPEGVKVDLVHALVGEGEMLVASGAEGTAPREIAGAWDETEQLVRVSLDQSDIDIENTLYHEMFHTVQLMLTKAEAEILHEQYPAERMSPKEDGATGFAEWAVGYGDHTPAAQRIFKKISQFFERVGNWLRKRGFKSVEDVFENIYSGEVAAREHDAAMTDVWASIEEATGWAVNEKEAAKLLKRDLKATMEAITEPFTGIKPKGLFEVENAVASGDMTALVRFLYPPSLALAKYAPGLVALHERGSELIAQQSLWTREFQEEFSAILKPLSDQETEHWAEMLWAGSDMATVFTTEEMTRGYVENEDGSKTWLAGENIIPSETTIKAYNETRQFFDKIGMMLNKHELAMKPTYRAAKRALIRRLGKMRQMEHAEFKVLVQKALRLGSKLRHADYADASPEAQAALEEQKADIEAQIFGILDENPDSKEAEAFREDYFELLSLEEKLQATAINKRKGYVPHKFFGSWGVYKVTEQALVDEDGNSVLDDDGNPKMAEHYELIPGWSNPSFLERRRGAKVQVQGFWDNQEAAKRGARTHAAKDPGARIVVRPVAPRFATKTGTQLSDASYHRLIGKLTAKYELEMGEISEIARKRSRRMFFGPKQQRKGTEGYSRDIVRVMEGFIGESMRYINMDEFKYKAVIATEKAGLSPLKGKGQIHPVTSKFVENWISDVLAEKQNLEQSVDDIFAKSWATPLNAAMTSGGLTFLLMGGVAANPLIGALAGSYVGYRFYQGLARHSDNPTRAITGAMLGDMAHVKLGMYLNILSPVTNISQTAMGGSAVLGKWIIEGQKRYFATMGAAATFDKTAPGDRTQAHLDLMLLRSANVDTKFRHSDQTPNLFEKESEIAKGSLFWFSHSEKYNRGSAYLGAYARAEAAGANRTQAKKQAAAVMTRIHFDYSNMDKPEILRNVFLRVPFQFKNFMIHQIAFMAGIRSKNNPNRNAESLRFMLGLFFVAGTLGIPLLDFLDELIKLLFGEEASPINAVKRVALQAQARGDTWGSAVGVLARGLPSLVGLDMSLRAGHGEKFLPLNIRDLQGPWWTTMATARSYGEMNATFTDQLRNLSSGLGAFKTLEAMNNGIPLFYSIGRGDWAGMRDRFTDGRIIYTNPWQRGRLEYEPTRREIFLRTIGGTPIREAQERAVRDITRATSQAYIRDQEHAIDQIVMALRADDYDQVRAVLRRAAENGIRVTPDQITYALRQAHMPRMMRFLMNTRRELRPGLIELLQGIPEPGDDNATNDLQ